MLVPFELQGSHKRILIATREHGVKRLKKLESAVHLLEESEGDFSRLLNHALDAEGSWLDSALGPTGFALGWLVGGGGKTRRPRQPPVPRTFLDDLKALEVLGLLEQTPVYVEGKDSEGNPARQLVDHEVALTAEGVRIADAVLDDRRIMLRPAPDKQTSVFVACAFGHDELDALYARELRPACEQLGYRAVRVDLDEPAETLSQAVLDGIRAAKVVTADLTYARPSVYFEIGVAYGLGIPVILTCRQDHFRSAQDAARVHFDLEQFKISYWNRSDERFFWSRGMHPGERLAGVLRQPEARAEA